VPHVEPLEQDSEGGIDEMEGCEPKAADRMSGLAAETDMLVGCGAETTRFVALTFKIPSDALRSAGITTWSEGASTDSKCCSLDRGEALAETDEMEDPKADDKSSSDSVSTGGSLRDIFRPGLESDESRRTGS
jgi:hypothetical protein